MGLESVIVRAIGMTVPVLIRWRYPVSRFERLIDIAVPSEGDGFRYDAYSQEASCWIEITNRSPFDIVADRISMRIVLANTSGSIAALMPHTIPSVSREKSRVFGAFFRPEVKHLVSASRDPKPFIEAEIVFTSKVRSFVLRKYFEQLRNISIVNVPSA